MRTNGKWNNFRAQAEFFFQSEPNTPEGPEYEKYPHYIDVRGDVLPHPYGTTAAVAIAK